MGRADGGRGRVAVQHRHLDIHEYGVECSGGGRREDVHRYLPVLGACEGHSFHFEDFLSDFAVQIVVFHQQHVTAAQTGRLALRARFQFRRGGGGFLLRYGGERMIEGRREEGLGKERVCPGLARPLFDGRPVVGRNNDDQGFRPNHFADAARGLDAVHLRHFPVDEADVIAVATFVGVHDLIERLPRRQDPLGRNAHPPQDEGRIFAGVEVVVDDEHFHIPRYLLFFLDMAVGGERKREFDGEARAFVLLAPYPDGAVHERDKVVRDGEPKPRPPVLL